MIRSTAFGPGHRRLSPAARCSHSCGGDCFCANCKSCRFSADRWPARWHAVRAVYPIGIFALARLEAQWAAVIGESGGLSAPAAAMAVSAVRGGDCGLGRGSHVRRHTDQVCHRKTVFGWVPAGFSATTAADAASYSTYPRTILLITFGSLILINGVAAPIVEELYFRGYLMPRISASAGRLRSWRTPLRPLPHLAAMGVRDHPAHDDLLHRSGLPGAISTSESGRTCR